MDDDTDIDLPLVLAECWQYWAERAVTMTLEEWTTPTRCPPWDVAALVAHASPDPETLEQVVREAAPGEAAFTDASDLLRFFNESGGAAHAMASSVAAVATETAAALGSQGLVQRFVDGAGIVLREPGPSPEMVVPYPVAGTVTLGVLTSVAVVEAVVHYLDLVAAIGGDPLPVIAMDHARDVLVRVSDPAPLIEAITGRRNPLTWFPLIR